MSVNKSKFNFQLISLALSREFMQCDEKTTIWGNSYETSIAKSEGSSDSSQTSKKLSFDFTSSTIHTSSVTVTSMVLDSDKENHIGAETANDVDTFIIPLAPKESLDGGSKSISLNNSSGLTNMTVEIHADEKRRIRKYGTDNLNITNMNLDLSLMAKNVRASDEKMVLSPRKTIYFNDNANISVCIQDKVLIKESEAATKSVSDSISFTLEEDEKSCMKTERKTILNHADMDLTLDPPKPSVAATVPKIFKQPETPKPFRMAPRFEASMNLDSPPIKPPKLDNQKQVVDEFMEYLVNETPTKNLCRQMCSSKKHNITPLQNPPPAKFTAASAVGKLVVSGRSSTTILKDLGLDFSSPLLSQQDKKEETSMELENPSPKNRKTIFDASIAIEPTAEKIPQEVKEARKTLFEDEMNETLSQKTVDDEPPKASQETFFDLDIDETVAVPLVKLRDIPVQHKRETVYNNDISFTCNFADMAAYKPCSTLMNYSNMDETGVSESTNELARRASRLLKNPMATTASNSNLFSKSACDFPEMDISAASPLQKSMPVRNLAREAVYDANMSLNLESPKIFSQESPKIFSQESLKSSQESSVKSFANISGIEPTADISKTILQKPRATIYANQTMQEDSLPELSPKVSKTDSRKTIYGGDSITETSIIQHKVAPESKRETICGSEAIHETNVGDEMSFEAVVEPKKLRVTIYEDSLIEEEEKSQNLPPPPDEVKSRKTIHEALAMNETNVEDEIEVSMTRRATFSHSIPNFEESQRENSISRFGLTSFNVKDSPPRPEIQQEAEQSLTSVFIPPPPEFNSPMYVAPHQTVYEAHEMETEENLTERPSVIVEPSTEYHRKTLHEPVNMEFDNDVKENKTFTVRKDDSKKLMNITDADIISLIDDESNPCIDDDSNSCANESTRSTANRISIGANNSIYQNALQDFVNITIMNSPLNASSYVQTPATIPIGRAKNRMIPEPVDYCSKLDNLVESLQKKDEPAPRLAIDEFLEKLNIRPVKISHYPELEPDWLQKEDEKIKEKIAREAAERKARLAAAELLYQPLIPDFSFLIRNKLEK